ncbi:MAG TPA: YCF48-related protein [Pyrinomonadaceae bacterium]|nr:YCF48-related protein [Pyrinomonadaceae bacterium]
MCCSVLWLISSSACSLVGTPNIGGGTPNIKVQFVNSRAGWIVGERLWRTDDGGLTWKTVRSNGFGTFKAEYVGYGHRAIQFIDSEVAVQLVGNTLAKTTDGGRTWAQKLPIPTPDNQDIPPQTVFFFSRELGWIVGELVYRTTDGGSNWQVVSSTPLGDSQNQRNMRIAPAYADYMPSLWFTDPKHGVMARLDGEVYATSDGGDTWQLVLRADRRINDLIFVDAQDGWMVGTEGFLAKTVDGGRTWTTLRTPTTADLNSISFAGKRIGCAVGEDGTILFTKDGGLTWNIAPIPFTRSRPPLASIGFADELHAWAVGGNSDPMKPSLSAPSSVVVATDDGGQTWRVVQL